MACAYLSRGTTLPLRSHFLNVKETTSDISHVHCCRTLSLHLCTIEWYIRDILLSDVLLTLRYLALSKIRRTI
jgi:hypothetical protein